MSERLSAEEREALAESLAPDVYDLVMETARDSWRKWRYLTDDAKARHRTDAALIVANALAPAVERILAAHLADMEARLAAAWDTGLQAGISLVERGYAAPNPYRAALHPDPSEPTGEKP